MQSAYDVALICLNGHVVNDHSLDRPDRNTKHCMKCGQIAINMCVNCNGPIRGAAARVYGGYQLPGYCSECGKPFPWTAAAISAAKDYADILEGITTSEKEEIKLAIGELAAESPKQTVAAAKFRKIAAKAGQAALDGFQKILVAVVSETIKKSIWP